jgi:hypothetical protein
MKPLVTAFLLSVVCYAADQKLGQPLTLKEAMPVATLLAKPDPFVGKTVQVKGKITEVCQMMGCWMNLTDNEGHLLRIDVEEGVVVLPKDSAGKMAIAEGKLEKHTLTRDQLRAEAQHEAEDAGRKFDPSTIKSGKVIYGIAGTSAVILDN